MEQLADREAQLEHDLAAAHDGYELDFTPVTSPEADLACRTPPPRRTSATRRRNRGR